jgi:DNA-binding MarR family transcriptional regulator
MCWPELQTLCRWTCLSRSSVNRALDRLEEQGLLVRHRTGRATRYQLVLELQKRHTETSEASQRHTESEGIRIEPQKPHSDASAVSVTHQMCHTDTSAGRLPPTAPLTVDTRGTATEGVAAIDSDASLEAQARAYAHGASDPEAAYRGALERLQQLQSRHTQPQEASTVLERMSSAKVLHRGRLHR